MNKEELTTVKEILEEYNLTETHKTLYEKLCLIIEIGELNKRLDECYAKMDSLKGNEVQENVEG